MKIYQLISGIQLPITNEEQQFIDKHKSQVKMTSLDEHEQWVAQNLVRKGAYIVSEDNVTLIKKIHENNSK